MGLVASSWDTQHKPGSIIWHLWQQWGKIITSGHTLITEKFSPSLRNRTFKTGPISQTFYLNKHFKLWQPWKYFPVATLSVCTTLETLKGITLVEWSLSTKFIYFSNNSLRKVFQSSLYKLRKLRLIVFLPGSTSEWQYWEPKGKGLFPKSLLFH